MTAAKTPYRIEWRPKAREDLRAIVRYIAKDNPLRARTFGPELRNKTLPLADHPALGRPGRAGDDRGGGRPEEHHDRRLVRIPWAVDVQREPGRVRRGGVRRRDAAIGDAERNPGAAARQQGHRGRKRGHPATPHRVRGSGPVSGHCCGTLRSLLVS